MNYNRNLLVHLVYILYLILNIVVIAFRWSQFELWLIIEIITFLFIVSSFLSLTDYGLTTQGLVTYFLVQSGLSIALLFLLLLFSASWLLNSSTLLIVLLGKLGILPFGTWVFPVFNQFTGLSLFNVIVWQKIAPLILLYSAVEFRVLLTLLVVVNMGISGILALSSLDLVSLLVFRSIANNSWFLLALYSQSFLSFSLLFFFYAIGVGFRMLSNKALSGIGLLILSGLPPFPLFFVKLFIIIVLGSWYAGSFIWLFTIVFLLSSVLLRSSYVRLYSTHFIIVIRK